MKDSQYFLYRQKLNLPIELPASLQFKIAQTQQEYVEASRILYECYLEKGYTEKNGSGMRMTPYHLLPTTTVILALWDNEIIGTISLIRDNPLGLPLEAIFDVQDLRVHNSVLCEVSSLAIKKEFRGKSGEIFHPLVRYMWNYALKYFGVDYFVIAVNPSMYELYESVYLFEPLKRNNLVTAYDFANNNPAVGEFINIKTSFDLFQKMYGEAPYTKNLHSFMLGDRNRNSQFPVRDYFTHIDSPVQISWVSDFESYIPELNSKPDLLNGISRAFGYLNYHEYQVQQAKCRLRVPVSFDVLNFAGCKVVDISENGIKVASKNPQNFETNVLFNCRISSGQQAKVLAEPVWENDSHVSGYRILDCSKSWEQMLQKTLDGNLISPIKKSAA